MVTSKSIVLVLSIIMPPNVQDIDHVQHVKSFDECWAAAREFTERDLTDSVRAMGGIGLKATCAYQEAPSDAN